MDRIEARKPVSGEISLIVSSEFDIVNARDKAKWLAKQIGFQGSDLTVISTLISELVRKIVAVHAVGNVTIQTVERGEKKGISISVSETPNRNVNRKTLGEGEQMTGNRIWYNQRIIALARRHVADEFEILPNGQDGIIVRVVKWL